MRLTSGSPFWLTLNGLPPTHPVLDHDLACDVAVLGGGISGALVTEALTRAGLTDVVVLDKHYPGTGATAASTALLQFEVDTPLTDLRREWGDAARADRAYQAVYRAFGHLTRELLPDLHAATNVGFQPTTSLYLAAHRRELPDLRAEAAARQAIGLPAELRTKDELRTLYRLHRPGAIFTAEAAQVDSLRLTTALHTRSMARGARLFERTEVVAYAADAGGMTLTTGHGFRVRARHVVVCTGYETPEWVTGIKVDLRSSFALVTQPLAPADRWPTDCHLWETRRPYTYCRVTPDGRVVAGGADLPFNSAPARDALLQARTRTVENALRDLLPWLPLDDRVDFRWAGTFGESPDGLPYVSQHPGFPHAWFALGFGGNGIVFATLAAELITAALVAGGHADLELFGFRRHGI